LTPLLAWAEHIGAIERLERDILINQEYHSGAAGPEASDAQSHLLAELSSARRQLRASLDDLTRSLS
jgi:hypothetical protein